MATIGTFTKDGRRIPRRDRDTEPPDEGRPHRPREDRTMTTPQTSHLLGRAEIGAAWIEDLHARTGPTSRSSWTTRASRLRSTPACSTIADEGYSLIWSRSRQA